MFKYGYKEFLQVQDENFSLTYCLGVKNAYCLGVKTPIV